MKLPTSSSKNESLKLKIMDWLKRYWASFSYVGLLLAVLFFSASLSPSLVPRSYTVQGALSGVALAVGDGPFEHPLTAGEAQLDARVAVETETTVSRAHLQGLAGRSFGEHRGRPPALVPVLPHQNRLDVQRPEDLYPR